MLEPEGPRKPVDGGTERFDWRVRRRAELAAQSAAEALERALARGEVLRTTPSASRVIVPMTDIGHDDARLPTTARGLLAALQAVPGARWRVTYAVVERPGGDRLGTVVVRWCLLPLHALMGWQGWAGGKTGGGQIVASRAGRPAGVPVAQNISSLLALIVAVGRSMPREGGSHELVSTGPRPATDPATAGA